MSSKNSKMGLQVGQSTDQDNWLVQTLFLCLKFFVKDLILVKTNEYKDKTLGLSQLTNDGIIMDTKFIPQVLSIS